ncbi:DNA gyrase inhibitor YacG [Glacieibacterium frigidum]|uniref:DNA gyrase inhibitor YacG n=1 Tax=Glacieibacterium frigidum TaxID=2593303 RepID=A0A552U9A6_9SPHN|nr:DNA gyrase inhibitor YacG [Glacieibacterium frigidum]TRW14806.1 DNA gyrase inhibitor YacG [Glacieibacterium frigidum]
MSPLSSPACPMCRRAASPEHAPFCSPRCKDRDLLKWLGDGYAIPGDPVDDEALDNESARD